MANRIELHPRSKGREVLVTVIDGQTVSLTGKPVKKQHPATETAAAWEETIPAATQPQLRKLYAQNPTDRDGYPLLVEVESTGAKDKDSK